MMTVNLRQIQRAPSNELTGLIGGGCIVTIDGDPRYKITPISVDSQAAKAKYADSQTVGTDTLTVNLSKSAQSKGHLGRG